MKTFLLCLVVAYAAAAPSGGSYAPPVPLEIPAVPVPHETYGLPNVLVSSTEIPTSSPIVPSAEYGLPTGTPIISGEQSSVIASSSLSSTASLPSTSLVPGYLPFAPLVQQPLPLVISPSVPFFATNHVTGFQSVLHSTFVPAVSSVPIVPGVHVQIPETVVQVPEERPIGGNTFVDANNESLSPNIEVPHSEYGLPVSEAPINIPAPPALPNLSSLPQVPVVEQASSTSAPVVTSPHALYGVPEIQSTTSAPLGQYPPRSEVVSHYGERIQVPLVLFK